MVDCGPVKEYFGGAEKHWNGVASAGGFGGFAELAAWDPALRGRLGPAIAAEQHGAHPFANDIPIRPKKLWRHCHRVRAWTD